jgi:polyhydroxyalkanoate synthesis regulator phasin
MTELEQQLTNALTALSKQYEAEMEQQAERVGELQKQVQRLEEAVKDLKPQLGQTTTRATRN